MIFDELRPGEDLGMVESNRPNVHLSEYRNGQLRAVAGGTRSGYSSISRDYNGSYSSQRQELVEGFEGYNVLQNWFVGQYSRPVYRAWVDMLRLSKIRLPDDVDMSSLYNALYLGPVMPWIDPVKEAESWKTIVRGGAGTEAEWVRARGKSPQEIKRQRVREVEFNRDHGLVLDSDAANDSGAKANETKNPGLMTPKASLSGIDAVNTETWYEIRAALGRPGQVEIYLYEEIGRWGISAQSFINDCREAGVFEASNVELHIHSPGGDVMHGFAIYNTLQRLTGQVDIYIDGLAASMASVIACLPNATVHMPSNAWIMIHKPWGGMAGDSDEMRDYANFLDRNEGR